LEDLKRKMGMLPKEEKIEIIEKSDVTIKIEVEDKKDGNA
jgi:phage shock protein A